MPIEFKELSHIYNASSPFPYVALHEINLAIKEGIFTAVIGETGSGKTTQIPQVRNQLLTTND